MSMRNDIGSQEHRERGRGRKAFWIVTAAALLIGLVFAMSSPRRDHFGAFQAHSAVVGWNVERALDAIDASDEQRVGLQPALERARLEAQQLTLAERELRAGLLAALETSELDPAEFSRLRANAIRISESAIATVFESTVEIWSVLTPEQRTEVLLHWKRQG